MSQELSFRIPSFADLGCSGCGACGGARATVAEVPIHDGMVIREGESLIALETGKAIMDVASPRSGTILRVNVKPGDAVAEGDLVAVLRCDPLAL